MTHLRTRLRKTLIGLALLVPALLLAACSNAPRYGYGVFLGAGPESLPDMAPYEILVIDAQYFTKEEIGELKAEGHTVLSYLNLGSLEDFRPYYEDYEDLTLGDYEHWEEERWADVSDPRWQQFTEDLARELLDKGVDGFYVDNCDVYYLYPEEDIFEGITAVLQYLKEQGAYVLINGGDGYVREYAERYHDLDILDGVNQETVFSRIDWEEGTFSANPEEERAYFQDYVEEVAAYGKDIFLLEYTTDPALIGEISDYCEAKGFRWYAAEDLELTAPGKGN